MWIKEQGMEGIMREILAKWQGKQDRWHERRQRVTTTWKPSVPVAMSEGRELTIEQWTGWLQKAIRALQMHRRDKEQEEDERRRLGEAIGEKRKEKHQWETTTHKNNSKGKEKGQVERETDGEATAFQPERR